MEAGEKAHAQEQSMTLVSVRVPTGDVEALRLAATATGGSVAHLIRRGVQRELAELRRDAKFLNEIRARRDELDRLVADLEQPIDEPEPRPRRERPARAGSKAAVR